MAELEVNDPAQELQDSAERWVQQVLDAELDRPASDAKLARLMLGAAILLNAIANVSAMDESTVQQLVSSYRKRVLVQCRGEVASA